MRLPLTRLGLSLGVSGLLLGAGLEFGRVAWGTGTWVGRFSLAWGLGFAGFALSCGLLFAGAMLAIWRPASARQAGARLAYGLSLRRGLRGVLVAALIVLPAFIVYFTDGGSIFTGPFVRLALLGACASIAVLFVADSARHPMDVAQLVLLGTGVAIVLAQALATVTDYPFSLSWSEGNRLWDYSLAFGRDRYRYPADQDIFAYISPGRQVLWGVVFLLPDATIWQARLWNAILLTLPYVVLGWAALRAGFHRVASPWRLAFAAWCLVFLTLGPIYTPLVLSAIVVALAGRLRPLALALALVALASYYAYDSRWTWMFAPGAWAALTALLEEPIMAGGRWRMGRLGRALAFVAAGLLGGYAIPSVLARASGAPGAVGVSDLGGTLARQPLLWYRLLPNPTYGPGIVLGLILATGPLVILLAYLIRARAWPLDWRQQVALGGVLAGFLAAGVVVSTKIGGGSNLHNLDMFLLTLAFAASLCLEAMGRAQGLHRLRSHVTGRGLLLLLVAVAPAIAITSGGPLQIPDRTAARAALDVIREEVAEAAEQGEVLFYDQRQLLTFGYVEDVLLVPEYEKKFMADRGLAGEPAFYEPFYQDLARHRFSLIISPPLETSWDEAHPFSEEDEVQVRYIYLPMAEHYEPAVRLDSVGVWLLRPRMEAAPGDAP